MLKSETKNIRHVFSVEEIAELNRSFHQSVKSVRAVESEFDSVKANYKARTAEAEAIADRLSTTIDAGFEMRQTKCVVVYRVKDRKKDYYLESDVVADELVKGAKVMLTEDMSDEDLQTELFAAESKFEAREDIDLFLPTETDKGQLIIGRQKGKWFTALRVTVGGRKIEERLDGEQPSTKKRYDAITKATKRFSAWLTESLGKEAADGFKEFLFQVCETHKEREE